VALDDEDLEKEGEILRKSERAHFRGRLERESRKYLGHRVGIELLGMWGGEIVLLAGVRVDHMRGMVVGSGYRLLRARLQSLRDRD